MKEMVKEYREITLDKDKNIFWQELWDGTGHFLTNWSINILREGLGDFVQSAIVETNYICKDHRNLYSYFYSKKFDLPAVYTYRIHFFKEKIKRQNFFDDFKKCQDAYLGYSVVRNISQRSLGRTVIDPAKIDRFLKNGYFSLRTKFRVHLFGKELEVKGYPYTSQDTDVTVCAHSALWGGMSIFVRALCCV